MAYFLVYLLACLPLIMADLERFCTQEDYWSGTRRGFCGSQLSDTLKLVCGLKGGYSTVSKRSAGSGPGAVGESAPFLSKHKAVAFLRRRRSYLPDGSTNMDQGIVCECCQNRCSLSELTQYCADPSPLTKKSVSLPGATNEKATDDIISGNRDKKSNSHVPLSKNSYPDDNEEGEIISRHVVDALQELGAMSNKKQGHELDQASDRERAQLTHEPEMPGIGNQALERQAWIHFDKALERPAKTQLGQKHRNSKSKQFKTGMGPRNEQETGGEY